MDFRGCLVDKEPICNAGCIGSIPGLGRSPGGGHGKPLQYSCLENFMDRGAWCNTVHRVTRNWTQLKWLIMHAPNMISVPMLAILLTFSLVPCQATMDLMGMSPVRKRSISIFGRWLLSYLLQYAKPRFNPWIRKITWRRKWQSTPVLLPEKFHGQRGLVGYGPWDHRKSDTTEWLHFHFHFHLMSCPASP